MLWFARQALGVRTWTMIYPHQLQPLTLLWAKPANLNSPGRRKVLAAGFVSSISSHFARRFRGSVSGGYVQDSYAGEFENLKEKWDTQLWEIISLCFREAKKHTSNVSKTPLHPLHHLRLQCYSLGMEFKRRFGLGTSQLHFAPWLTAHEWRTCRPRRDCYIQIIHLEPLSITQLTINQGFQMIWGIAHVTVFTTCRERTGFSSGSVGGAASCAKWQRRDHQLYFFVPQIY